MTFAESPTIGATAAIDHSARLRSSRRIAERVADVAVASMPRARARRAGTPSTRASGRRHPGRYPRWLVSAGEALGDVPKASVVSPSGACPRRRPSRPSRCRSPAGWSCARSRRCRRGRPRRCRATHGNVAHLDLVGVGDPVVVGVRRVGVRAVGDLVGVADAVLVGVDAERVGEAPVLLAVGEPVAVGVRVLSGRCGVCAPPCRRRRRRRYRAPGSLRRPGPGPRKQRPRGRRSSGRAPSPGSRSACRFGWSRPRRRSPRRRAARRRTRRRFDRPPCANCARREPVIKPTGSHEARVLTWAWDRS